MTDDPDRRATQEDLDLIAAVDALVVELGPPTDTADGGEPR